jgi:hypothetical protein
VRANSAVTELVGHGARASRWAAHARRPLSRVDRKEKPAEREKKRALTSRSRRRPEVLRIGMNGSGELWEMGGAARRARSCAPGSDDARVWGARSLDSRVE